MTEFYSTVLHTNAPPPPCSVCGKYPSIEAILNDSKEIKGICKYCIAARRITAHRVTVCSFWVDRPRQFPNAPPYLPMLKILDASCTRFGFDHVVLCDRSTAARIHQIDLVPFGMILPDSLMQASTEAHARFLENSTVEGDTLFVGADCLIRRDFRHQLPRGDLAIAYMKDHKRWKMNNGFVFVPAASREKVAPLLRRIADDTSEQMFDDMLAIERALSPMPAEYGLHERHGLAVNFLPLDRWNKYMNRTAVTDDCHDANVLHFMGGHDNGKAHYFDWAHAHGFA